MSANDTVKLEPCGHWVQRRLLRRNAVVMLLNNEPPLCPHCAYPHQYSGNIGWQLLLLAKMPVEDKEFLDSLRDEWGADLTFKLNTPLGQFVTVVLPQ